MIEYTVCYLFLNPVNIKNKSTTRIKLLFLPLVMLLESEIGVSLPFLGKFELLEPALLIHPSPPHINHHTILKPADQGMALS
jgi:hypothetical protein